MSGLLNQLLDKSNFKPHQHMFSNTADSQKSHSNGQPMFITPGFDSYANTLAESGVPSTVPINQPIPNTTSTRSFPTPVPVSTTNKPTLCLSDFIILRTIGTGSFGRVHLVQLKANKSFYAMKVLKKTEVVRLKQVEHVNNERSVLETCHNSFLVNMLGTFQDTANIYMIMEYVPGGELFSYIRKFQRFPAYVARFYAAEVVLAFEFLHSMDIIYRDLKPENILINAQGHIKITDFGFAKHVPDITWTLCGTPDYLAPEIIQSKGYSKAVDWYSLGILIFELLAGFPPFYDDDHFKLYEKILAGKIRWPPHIDLTARDLIKRLTTPDLTKRFGNLKNGVWDIKRHPWFADIDWGKMSRLDVQPPIIPIVSGEGDTSNFDVYQESVEVYGLVTDDHYQHLFVDF